MEKILPIGVFIAWLLCLLLFMKKKGKLHDKLLAVYLFLVGLTILFIFLHNWNRINGYPYPWMFNLNAPWMLLHGPFIWVYVKANVTPKFKLPAKFAFHTLPFVLAFTLHAINYYSVPDEQKIHLAQSEAFKQYTTYPYMVFLISFSLVGYFVYSYRLLKKYEKNIYNSFSFVEEIDLNWLKNAVGGGIFLYSSICLIITSDLFLHYIEFRVFEYISSLAGTVYVVILGIYGLSRTNIFSSTEKYANEFVKLKPSKLLNDEADSKDLFVSKLMNYMEEEKPFIDYDISVGKLAKQLDVKPEYLSDILNSELKQNFFDFINTYRINEFKEKVKEPNNNNLTLIGIAYDCGFNSKATFNRVFKQKEKMTPSEYKKSQLK